MNESEQAIIQADTAQILSKIGKSPYLMTLRKGGGVGPVYSCIHEHYNSNNTFVSPTKVANESLPTNTLQSVQKKKGQVNKVK